MSTHSQSDSANPVSPESSLKINHEEGALEKSAAHPQKEQKDEDSAVTKAEKFERHGPSDEFEESPAKRVKLDNDLEHSAPTSSERQKGVAPIKPEYSCLR